MHTRTQRICALLISLTVGISAPASAEKLTAERLHQDPPLGGPSVLGAKVAPDGMRVIYQKSREGNSDVLDLWQFEPQSGAHSELLRAETLTDSTVELSAEEKARLERERIRSSGITHYSYSRSGEQLLIPLGGNLYVYRFDDDSVIELSQGGTKLDPKLSPDGHSVAYVQDRNLFVRRLSADSAVQLTADGSETIANGLAEFIAQEEMSRPYGYWWSPDSKRIAFIRYDESPVEIIERIAIGGDGATLIEQRYPLAGTANVGVRPGIVDVATKNTAWVDLGDETDIYVGRVDWDATGQTLYVQRQPREQDRLDLLTVDPETGSSKVLLSEQSDTWINLHDNLTPLDDGRLLWTSEKSGFSHVYLIEANGREASQITDGDWLVENIECVDESTGTFLFTGWLDDPRTSHLYRARLDDNSLSDPERVSERTGWHQISAARDCSLYLDTYSSPRQPPQTSLHDQAGKRLAWLEQNRLDETHPYAPFLATHSVPEFGTLLASDDTPIHFSLTKPSYMKAGEQYPAVVLVYGGPHVQRVQRRWGRLRDQLWADEGYVVFRLDNRGSWRRGHAFESHLHRHMGKVEVEDQLLGIEYLKSLPYVRADRIGVSGWSYGGFMSAIMLAKAGDEIAAGFVGAPVTDWGLYDTHYTERYLDHPEDNADGYKYSSVMPYVDGIVSPLLLVHGMADDNVVFTNATKFMQEMQHRNIAFDLMTYPGETHFIRNRTSRLHLDQLMSRFFERHLKSAED